MDDLGRRVAAELGFEYGDYREFHHRAGKAGNSSKPVSVALADHPDAVAASELLAACKNEHEDVVNVRQKIDDHLVIKQQFLGRLRRRDSAT